MGATSIEWTRNADGTPGHTWNPVRGCSMAKGSESGECLNCYAARMAARGLPGMNSPTTGKPFAIMRDSGPRWTGKVELIPHMLDVPFKRRKPTTYFVNSMSDLFHESLPFEAIDEVFTSMIAANWHKYLILTKRPERAREYFASGCHDRGNGPDRARYHLEEQIWLGTSIGLRSNLHRADELRACPTEVRFLSLEPLLEDLGTLDLTGIHWVIVGGESGPGARPLHPEWVRSIRDQCQSAGVPFFFKQWGEWAPHSGKCFYRGPIPEFRAPNEMGLVRVGKKAAGCLLDGREWMEYPEVPCG